MESGSFDIPGAGAIILALCIAESAAPTDFHVILFTARMGPMEVRLIGAGTRTAGCPIPFPTTGGSDSKVLIACFARQYLCGAGRFPSALGPI
jgi:hypothetical protein